MNFDVALIFFMNKALNTQEIINNEKIDVDYTKEVDEVKQKRKEKKKGKKSVVSGCLKDGLFRPLFTISYL